MNLFNYGDFTLHSGGGSTFKIDCDALTDNDLQALARIAVNILPPFGEVYGIPRGGERLAEALKPYATAGDKTLLIVDDVLTTGASIIGEFRKRAVNYQSITSLVIFNRSGGKWLNGHLVQSLFNFNA